MGHLLGCMCQIMWNVSLKSTWTGCHRVTGPLQVTWARWGQPGCVRLAVPCSLGVIALVLEHPGTTGATAHTQELCGESECSCCLTSVKRHVWKSEILDLISLSMRRLQNYPFRFTNTYRGGKKKQDIRRFFNLIKKRHCKMLPADRNRSYINFSDCNWHDVFHL